MTGVLDLLRSEPRARAFLLTYLQSSLGTGAGYLALVVLAYDRLHSPWAIALVLLADFLPAMTLGPLVGAIVDRSSRRACAVGADVVRAVAFIGLALVNSFEATVALALLAGIGTAFFSPSVLASLPSLVRPERLSAVTSLYGSVTDLGRTIGPLIAAVAFSLVGGETLMIINGATFAVSAVALRFLAFGGRATGERAAGRGALLREAREGLSTTAGVVGLRVVLFASSAIVLFAGMLNVSELLLAHDLGAGAAGFAVLSAALGVGVVAGSLSGARSAGLAVLKTRYLRGLLIVGTGLLLLSIVPFYAAALPAFLLVGLGNGLVVVHERLIFQQTVPTRLAGRAFAVLDTLASWAFAAAFLLAGVLISAIGTRGLLAVSAAGSLLVWGAASAGLRSVWGAREPVAANE